MKNWSVARRIVVSFGVIVGLVIMLAAVSGVLLTGITREVGKMRTGSQAASEYATDFIAAWQRGYALTLQSVLQRDASATAALESEIEANRAEQDRLLGLYEGTVANDAHQQLLDRAKVARTEYFRVKSAVLTLNASPQTQQAAQRMLFSGLAPAFEVMDSLVVQLAHMDQEEAHESDRLILAAIRTTEITGIAVFGIVILFALGSGWLLYGAITTPLNRLVTVVDVLRQGDFTQRVAFQNRDEFAVLGDGFNRMSE